MLGKSNEELLRLLKGDPDYKQKLEQETRLVEEQIQNLMQEEAAQIQKHDDIEPICEDFDAHFERIKAIRQQIQKTQQKLQEQIDYERCFCFVQDQLCRVIGCRDFQLRDKLKKMALEAKPEDLLGAAEKLIEDHLRQKEAQ